MAGATDWVRRALDELGPDAPDAGVKAYVRARAPGVPESYISLALRKMRGKVVAKRTGQSRSESKNTEPDTGADRPRG